MSKTQRDGRKSATGLMAAQRSAERRRKLLLVSIAVAVLVVFAGAIGFSLYRTQQHNTAVNVPPHATDTGIPIGKADAPVTLDVYLDYQCPVCKQFEQLTGSTIDQLTQQGTLRVVYHPVAFLDRASSTNYSSRASAAAGCAAADGVYPKFATQLYEQQPPEGGDGLPDDTLISIGKAAGAGDDFAGCVKDGTYAGWTQHLTDAASKDGVNGTPTLLVNGRQIEDRTPAGLKAAVAAAQPR
jgi:protein-disulfide isomerase